MDKHTNHEAIVPAPLIQCAEGIMDSIFHLLNEQVKFSGKTFEEIQIND